MHSLNTPLIRSAIQQAIDKYHLTIDDRASVMADILVAPEDVSTTYDSKGEVVSKTIHKRLELKLKTIRLLNSMDGSTSRASAVGAAAGRALAPLLREQLAAMREALAAERVEDSQGASPRSEGTVSVDSIGESASEAG